MSNNTFTFHDQILNDNKELISYYLEDPDFCQRIDYFRNNYEPELLYFIAIELKTKINGNYVNQQNKQEIYKIFFAILLAIKELEKNNEIENCTEIPKKFVK